MIAKAASGRREWLVPVLLILLSVVPAAVGTARLVELALGAQITEANARFFAMPLPAILHIVSLIPYSMIGALQFPTAFRRRRPRLHRNLGRPLIVLGLISALTGLWMTIFNPWPEGDGKGLYVLRLLAGTVMAISIVLSVAAILRRDFIAHGKWMIRGYAIAMGAGTQVLTHLPYFMLVGKPDVPSRAALMVVAWIINIVVAEWAIRKDPSWRSSVRRHSAAG